MRACGIWQTREFDFRFRVEWYTVKIYINDSVMFFSGDTRAAIHRFFQGRKPKLDSIIVHAFCMYGDLVCGVKLGGSQNMCADRKERARQRNSDDN